MRDRGWKGRARQYLSVADISAAVCGHDLTHTGFLSSRCDSPDPCTGVLFAGPSENTQG